MFVVKTDDIEEDEYEQSELKAMELQGEIGGVVELCINSMVGLTNLGTMKIRGVIEGKEVIVLVDCGATHNFISDKLVMTLHIPTKDTSNYGEILGSGTTIKGKGVCEQVKLSLNGWTVTADFLPLELGGVDMILGMQWLYSLGVTEVDWKNLVMSFVHNNKKVVIIGDPSLTKTQVSLKCLTKSWTESDLGYLVECRALEARITEPDPRTEEGIITIPEKVQAVLRQYGDVFEWPEELPPERAIEHHIHLKRGTNQINVRPYRYAFQQEEMEKLVDEMISSGIIRPNTSPYSSPVLLVKKRRELAVLRGLSSIEQRHHPR